jgi:hypothetical protein
MNVIDVLGSGDGAVNNVSLERLKGMLIVSFLSSFALSYGDA